MFINKTPVKLLCCVFRACNFKYIAIQWEEPASYGDALIVGYKVFINGVVEAVLGQDQRSYSFTNGKWCKEYIFQVQALTNNDELHSKPSDPLLVTWPGVQSPVINRAPSVNGNCVTVRWISPDVTDGVRMKHFKVSGHTSSILATDSIDLYWLTRHLTLRATC